MNIINKITNNKILNKIFNIKINKLNLTVLIFVLFVLFILYNTFLLNRPRYYNIEGYTPPAPLSNETTCISPLETSMITDNCPGLKNPKIIFGTCADSYPANSDEFRRCVDIGSPSSITPASGITQEVAQTFCTNVKKRETSYKNYMASFDCPQDS